MGNAKRSYANAVLRQIWKQKNLTPACYGIIEVILNRGLKVISSASHKGKIFSMNFGSNSMLCPKGHNSCRTHTSHGTQTLQYLCLRLEISKIYESLESTKVTSPNKIPVVKPELFPVLVKMFNSCLKEKYFPDQWNVSVVCQICKKASECSALSQNCPISLLSHRQESSWSPQQSERQTVWILLFWCHCT